MSFEWSGFFPFAGEFEDVVDQNLSVEWLTGVVEVLTVVVEELAGNMSVLRDGSRPDLLRLYLCVTRVLIRASAALTYMEDESDLLLLRDQPDLVISYMVSTCHDELQTRVLPMVDYTPELLAYLDPLVRSIWQAGSLRSITSLAVAVQRFYPLLVDTRVTILGSCCVESSMGVLAVDVSDEVASMVCLLPSEFFSLVLRAVVHDAVEVLPLHRREESVIRALAKHSWIKSLDFFTANKGLLAEFMWLILECSRVLHVGACYLRVVPLIYRRVAYAVLGTYPLLSTVSAWLKLNNLVVPLAPAVCREVSYRMLHVYSYGSLPIDYYGREYKIGGPPLDGFSKDAVDQFLRAHLPRPPGHSEVVPLRHVGPASVSGSYQVAPVVTQATNSLKPRDDTLDSIASDLLAGVGMPLSPQQPKQVRFVDDIGIGLSGYKSVDHYNRDKERLAEFLVRLDSGAIISERYIRTLIRSASRGTVRPTMGLTRGRAFHVGDKFLVPGRAISDGWYEDTSFVIPGWSTMVLKLPAGNHSIQFSPPRSVSDARLDFTGSFEVTFDATLSMVVEDLVLWFTDSVRFDVRTTDRSVIRAFIPNAVNVAAVDWEVRRLSMISGYSYLHYGFSVAPSFGSYAVTLMPQLHRYDDVKGYACFGASVSLSVGVTSIRLSSTSYQTPARLVFVTQPTQALQRLTFDNISYGTLKRPHICFSTNRWQDEYQIVVSMPCSIRVSLLQVTQAHTFDATVSS